MGISPTGKRRLVTAHPQNGLIVHANHFQSPVALSKLLDKGIANMPDSLYRDIRVRGLLEPHVGRLTPELTKQAFFDDFETPWSVCRPPRDTFAGSNQSATVAMLIMEPALGTMEIAPPGPRIATSPPII